MNKFADKYVWWLSIFAAGFLAGMWAAEEKSAVMLQPCPKNAKMTLTKMEVTGQICTYAEIVRGGSKFKWEIRKI